MLVFVSLLLASPLAARAQIPADQPDADPVDDDDATQIEDDSHIPYDDEPTWEDEPQPERPPAFIDNPFLLVSMGLGYFHPLADIGDRHGPGWNASIRFMVYGERLGFGLDMRWLFSQKTDEPIVIPVGLEDNAEPIALGTNPEATQVGLATGFALYRSEHWFVDLGVSVGYRWYSLQFDGEDKLGGFYDDYRRRRHGIGIREDLSVAFLWHLTPALGLGPLLTLSLTEAFTTDADGVQPDLGREDGARYGMELWPQAMLSLLVISAPTDSPERMAELRAMKADFKHRYRGDMSFGYFHPLGKIADSHPPGAAVEFYNAVRLSVIELGIDMIVAPSFDHGDRIVLADGAEDNPHTRPWRLESHPFMLNAAVIFNPLVLTAGDWLFAVGIRIGGGYHMIGRGKSGKTPDGEKFNLDDYRRKWIGLVIGQHVDVAWYPSLDGTVGAIGFCLRLRLDEMRTWNADPDRPKLGDNEPRSYGWEWWPAILAGVTFRF
jgi:hypothetical protein